MSEIVLNIQKPRVQFWRHCERHTADNGLSRSTANRYETVIRSLTKACDFRNLTHSYSTS